MKFIHRLGFYLGGFVIGLVLLFFFLGGKRTSCDYGPESRVLKNIRLKERHFSEDVILAMTEKQIDTAAISKILKNGDVLFSDSNTDLDSCKIYAIEGLIKEKTLKIRVENCDSIATVMEMIYDQ